MGPHKCLEVHRTVTHKYCSWNLKNQKIYYTNVNPPTLQMISLDSGFKPKHLVKHMQGRQINIHMPWEYSVFYFLTSGIKFVIHPKFFICSLLFFHFIYFKWTNKPTALSTILVIKAAGGWSNKNETLTLVIRGKPRIQELIQGNF